MDTRDSSSNTPSLTRRQAMAALAAAGGYALAANPVLAQAIQTDSQGIIDSRITIAGDGGTVIPAYEAYPATDGEFPVVLVISEPFGIHEWIKDMTRRFAKAGYYAVAPELFSREGGMAQVTDMKKVADTAFNAPLSRLVGDIKAAADYARKQPAARGDRVGVTGFCWGGGIALTFAGMYKDTSAVVSWYGSIKRAQKDDPKPLSALDVAGQIPCPVLLLYSGIDQNIPVTDVEQMEATIKTAGRPVEKVIYPNAAHGFLADYRPSYNPEAAKDGWARCLGWFQTYLKS